MEFLIDKVLVLKRIGDKYCLPSRAFEQVEMEGGRVVPYLAVRVKDHDIFGGLLLVKLEPGNYDERYFQISIEVNSATLAGFEIKRIQFAPEEPSMPAKKFIKKRVPYQVQEPVLDAFPTSSTAISFVPPPAPVIIPYHEQVRETYELSAKYITIEDGKASFRKYVKRLKKELLFEVTNEFFAKKFDPVKHYFFKCLGVKKVEVTVVIEIEDNRIVSQTAASERLAAINESTIEFVYDLVVEDVILNANGDISALEEKAVDILNLQGDNKEEQLQNLLTKLFDREKTKHYNHLSYLSNKHLHNHMKLMLTGGPLSFMFLLKGATHLFFIWEPYSSDVATYIWKLKSSEGSPQMQEEIKGIVEEVKWLKKGNKTGFIKKGDPGRKKIIHDYQLPGNGFKKWKEELNEYLS